MEDKVKLRQSEKGKELGLKPTLNAEVGLQSIKDHCLSVLKQ